MIIGKINANVEAVVNLVVVGPDESEVDVDALIDTGFSGDLTLPPDVIDTLQLIWLGRQLGILADGSTDLIDVYLAVVQWDGSRRDVEIDAAITQPLVGMNLLLGHSLQIEVVENGVVAIAPLA